jgi:quinol-cytochrome oxidoreductase complex cytochrome b subunit
VHFILLHEYGSTNPLGLSSSTDEIPFVPFYLSKDFLSISIIIIIIFFFLFFNPLVLGHTDNLIEANFLVTPPHIVPEWYFLPLYCILRSVPNKLFGLFLIVLFILSIIFLPFYNRGLIRGTIFKPFYSFFVWVFFLTCLCLA